ncbi:BICD2 [Fasciolopsis buskii]|uniref:BICD2 n=1 Tax=Fasciolopsis buskii TaxID=27845 RepID=A0A8E0S3P0_9TREM|nr:BICD2 [Fasciolopsis buski]
MEAEKNELNRLLEEAQRSLELANSEASNKQERINGLLAQLDAIMSVRSEADEEFERKEAENDPPALELAVPGGHNAKDIMAESTLSVLLQVTELAERLQIPLRLDHKESPDVSVTSDVNTDDEGDRLVMHLAPVDSPNSEILSNAVDLQLVMANHLRHLLCSFSEKYTQVIKKSTGQVSMDLEEAQREIVKLKASVEVKREQVTMLRNMLRTNTTTAETALANLKQKYEKEKHMVTATMQSLRDELAVLKEESAKNVSLRTIYSQRYEEFAAQIDQMQQKLLYAENERRTLNSLLRLAIHQKLDLTQRLEDIEVKQEERGYFQQQQHNPGPHTAIPASYGIPQAQHPAVRCANSLLPNPVHPQPYVLGNHPVGAPPFSPPEPSGVGRASAVADAGAGGVHQTSGLPVHRTILSPQHTTSPNSHSGAKFTSSGPDRSKVIQLIVLSLVLGSCISLDSPMVIRGGSFLVF